MKRRALWPLSMIVLLVLLGPALVAQNPNYNNGRIISSASRAF
jgi:hypothetical protein